MRSVAATMGMLCLGLTAALAACDVADPGADTGSAGSASGSNPGVAGSAPQGGSSGARSVMGGTANTLGGGSNAGSNNAGNTNAAVDPKCNRSLAVWSDDSDLWASVTEGPNFLRKNFWNHTAAGAGDLTLWSLSSRCWGAEATASDSMKPGTVKSYPDMARGWVVGTEGFQNPDSKLPILVSDLKKAKIRWKMSVTGSPLREYALWDIYFHESAMPGSGNAPVNLMIKQRVTDPSGYEQKIESGGANAKVNTFGGIMFRENKNTGLKSGTRAVVELFALPINGNEMGVDDMTLDLKEVIDHYVADGSIKPTDYLTSIQTGWEICAGGSFVTKDFWTALQDEPDPAPLP